MQSRKGSCTSLEEGLHPLKIVNQSHKHMPLRLLLLFLLLAVGVAFLYIGMYTSRYVNVQHVVSPIQSRIRGCVQEPKNLENWIRPPTFLLHEMNDTELFWRSSFVPKIRGYPFKRTPKIAFMFLTRGPLPLAPLWDKFFKGSSQFFSIYIHSLPSYEPDFPPYSPFYGRQIPSQVAEWGMMSMCDAERRLLANALLDISNEWFVLVSESCIPLRNFTTVYKYISKSQFSFIGAFDELGPCGRGRYNEKLSPEVNLTNWRKGSQWFEINRKLAIDIVQDAVYYPKFEMFCKPDCYVDEHYFPTMLSIQSPHLLANRTLTWVDWSRGGPHPATFGRVDITGKFFEEYIGGGSTCVYNNHPSNVCFMFARKFAPNTLDYLMEHSSKYFGF